MFLWLRAKWATSRWEYFSWQRVWRPWSVEKSEAVALAAPTMNGTNCNFCWCRSDCRRNSKRRVELSSPWMKSSWSELPLGRKGRSSVSESAGEGMTNGDVVEYPSGAVAGLG